MRIRIRIDPNIPPEIIIKQDKDLIQFPDEPPVLLNEENHSFLMVAGDKTVLMQGDSFRSAKKIKEVFTPRRGEFDNGYAGITSIYRIPNSKRILGFYHAEDWHHRGFVKNSKEVIAAIWSIGIAESEDDCQTFNKRQQLLKSSVPREDAVEDDHQGIGDVHVIANKEETHLYAYYTDLSYRTKKNRLPANIGFASCEIENASIPNCWKKLNGNEGEELAVLKAKEEHTDYIAPFVLKVWNRYLMVFSRLDSVAYEEKVKRVGRSGICFSVSTDGKKWSAPELLISCFPIPTGGKEYKGHPSIFIPKDQENEKDSMDGHLVFGYSKSWGNGEGMDYHQMAVIPITISNENTLDFLL